MPKREDEFWAGLKNGLRWCVLHRCRYRADLGCQKCTEERLAVKPAEPISVKLLKCPSCGLTSLAWYEAHERYECGNRHCFIVYTEVEFNLTKKKRRRKKS